jgi:transcription initiation factor TFIIF subunit beta
MELDKDSDEKDFTDSDEDQIFGIENKDLKTWLVKIPTFVAERWNSVQEPGVELGVLRIYKNQIPDPSKPGSFKSKVTLHVENDAVQMPIPKNYNLTITNLESKNQYVFTESSQGKAVEVIRC